MDLNPALGALTAAITARTDVQGRLTVAAAALEQARAVDRAKQDALEGAIAAEQEASVDTVLDCASARRDAEAIAQAASRGVSTAHQRHGLVAAEFAKAQRAVETAADVVLAGESEILAQKCAHHLAEVMRIGSMLRGYFPATIDTPIDKLHMPTPRVIQALEALERDSNMRTPSTELRFGRAGSDWAARRRAALITTGSADDNDAQAAA